MKTRAAAVDQSWRDREDVKKRVENLRKEMVEREAERKRKEREEQDNAKLISANASPPRPSNSSPNPSFPMPPANTSASKKSESTTLKKTASKGGGSRKGQWTDEEDAIVVEAVQNSVEQPFTRWSDLASRLPGRVGKQCRDRWANHLNPEINHLPFSREDDLMLREGHHDLGKRWVEIGTKYFKGTRSENQLKNRWHSAKCKKFIAKEFGPCVG